MQNRITASMLYDLVHCPHRVAQDLFGDPALRDEPNPFVQLLWERGALFECETIAALGIPFVDLRPYAGVDKERRTREAMSEGAALIYNGRIEADNLLGEPDLLRLEGGGYIAGDIKSGSAETGDAEDSRPKRHYAVQLALYTDILERLRLSGGRRGFIWDIHGEEVVYEFEVAHGIRNPRTLWQEYESCRAAAEAIIDHSNATRAAYGAACKQCCWYNACLRELIAVHDLSLIPELGRAKRDAIATQVSTIEELADADADSWIQGGKTIFRGIGPATLRKLQRRAQLIARHEQAYLRAPITLPDADIELFFDIEVDPMRDLCYLHGFVERRNGDNATEQFVAFFADEPTADAEREAFAAALAYIRARQPCAIYYYSKYERTLYRSLCARYPEVCSAEEIEALFDPASAVDLYFDVVLRATEWPTRDYSIKTLARYLGFAWRDSHPSGAASIEWFHRWVETGDARVKARLLAYNEDDCRATRVLLDGIRALPLKIETEGDAD